MLQNKKKIIKKIIRTVISGSYKSFGINLNNQMCLMFAKTAKHSQFLKIMAHECVCVYGLQNCNLGHAQ